MGFWGTQSKRHNSPLLTKRIQSAIAIPPVFFQKHKLKKRYNSVFTQNQRHQQESPRNNIMAPYQGLVQQNTEAVKPKQLKNKSIVSQNVHRIIKSQVQANDHGHTESQPLFQSQAKFIQKLINDQQPQKSYIRSTGIRSVKTSQLVSKLVSKRPSTSTIDEPIARQIECVPALPLTFDQKLPQRVITARSTSAIANFEIQQCPTARSTQVKQKMQAYLSKRLHTQSNISNLEQGQIAKVHDGPEEMHSANVRFMQQMKLKENCGDDVIGQICY